MRLTKRLWSVGSQTLSTHIYLATHIRYLFCPRRLSVLIPMGQRSGCFLLELSDAVIYRAERCGSGRCAITRIRLWFSKVNDTIVRSSSFTSLLSSSSWGKGQLVCV